MENTRIEIKKLLTLLASQQQLSTKLLRVSRADFRKVFCVDRSPDVTQMVECQQTLFEHGFIMVSVATGEETDYFFTSITNPVFKNAIHLDSDSLRDSLIQLSTINQQIKTILSLNLSPKLSSRTICQVAGHSSVLTTPNDKVFCCFRCGLRVKPAESSVIVYTETAPKSVQYTGYRTRASMHRASLVTENDLLGIDLQSEVARDIMALVVPYVSQQDHALLESSGLQISMLSERLKELAGGAKLVSASKQKKQPKKTQSTLSSDKKPKSATKPKSSLTMAEKVDKKVERKAVKKAEKPKADKKADKKAEKSEKKADKKAAKADKKAAKAEKSTKSDKISK